MVQKSGSAREGRPSPDRSTPTPSSSSRGAGGGSSPLIGLDYDESSDPRIDAFHDFVAALDRRDHRAGLAAAQRLRRLGLSVVLVPTRPGGGAA